LNSRRETKSAGSKSQFPNSTTEWGLFGRFVEKNLFAAATGLRVWKCRPHLADVTLKTVQI